MREPRTRFLWWVVGAIMFALGLGLGYRLDQQAAINQVPQKFSWRAVATPYSFINPLLACQSVDKSLLSKYQELRSGLRRIANQEVQTGHATKIAVYFRELKTGQWTGVNEDDTFYPASLFKLPIMMVVLKEAETNPAILAKKVVYKQTAPENNNELNSSTTTNLKPGTAYTVDQLVEAMIVDSDNNAKDLLEDVVDEKVVSDLFGSLDIPMPYGGLSDSTYGISPRQYSLFFRVLYNSTYLNESMSERALTLLSRAVFADGLVAGLPANTKTAHKFGVYNSGEGGKGIHDCGIVYNANNPYLACVMTKGNDYIQMEGAIAKLSSTINKYVQTYGNKS